MAVPSSIRDARTGLSGPARAALDTTAVALGGALAALAATRRAKALHPAGAVYAARLVVDGSPHAPHGAPLLRNPGEHAAVIRFSRALGLPRPLPDLLGAAIRVLDAHGPHRHQDLLLTTSIDRPVLHHVFVPASDAQQRVYSSSLPYRAGAGPSFLVGLLPDPASPRPAGATELERLDAAAQTGALRFRLGVAALRGRFRPIATVHVTGPLPDAADALRFNPWNTGGGLRPSGWLNRMRAYAYPMSQRAWR